MKLSTAMFSSVKITVNKDSVFKIFDKISERLKKVSVKKNPALPVPLGRPSTSRNTKVTGWFTTVRRGAAR